MLTTLAVISRIFSNSVANLYQKKASETSSSVVTNLVAYFIMSAICFIPATFVNWSQYNLNFWLNVIFAGTLCTIGTIALIEALKIGELSVLAPINAYKSLVGLLGAFLLLGEFPCTKDLICVFFIIVGSYFVLVENNNKFSLKIFLRRDIRLRIFALLCSGIEAAFLKKIILLSSFEVCLILWCFSGFVCSLIIFLLKREPLKIKKGSLPDCTIIALMLLIMQLTTNYVFSKIEVGTALALFQLSSLVSLYFGYKIFHESNMFRKIIGTVIMISAAVVILL
ncbi:MAG: EamA family transporter [Cyanobacteria bacterium RUI128]|nr:EamA family transporter [Cyanobacteria bacterium RUI128]